MTCKNYKELDQAVEYIKDNSPVTEHLGQYKSVSRVLTSIKKNINLFIIDTNTIAINPDYDDYFYNNFYLKYDFAELNEILLRDVDYSYFLYNLQNFNINLIDKPAASTVVSPDPANIAHKEVIKVETATEENDIDYVVMVDTINENNVNKDVANNAHTTAPILVETTSSSTRYRRNPLLGKIAIQNAYYCCERDAHHETFTSAKTNRSFMEAHHLVPVKYQQAIWEKYGVNVDCVENIVSLCPTCHRAFHNGSKQVKEEMIEELYNKLIPRYKSINFDITVDEIKKLYKVN